MNINEIESFFQLFGGVGIEVVINSIVIFLLLKYFLPSYLSSKAKNLATKEDIGEITKEIEQVKLGYAQMLEEVKSNHQLKLASIEREKLLKKEVYLDSVEALTQYQNSLAIMSNLDIPNQVVTDSFTSSAAQISKVMLVGSEETVRNLTSFTGEVAAAYMNLFLERGALINRKANIELLEKYRKKHEGEIEYYLSIMRKMCLDGVSEDGGWARVNLAFEGERNSRDQVAAEINAAWKVQNEELFIFTKRCMSEFFRVNDLTPYLILSVRTELDLHLDENEYIKIHTENTRKAKEVFEAFMNNLRESF